MTDVIIIRYQGWMNWCYHIGLGAFIFTFLNIAIGNQTLGSPYGLILAVASFEIVVTTAARSRFRAMAIKTLTDRGVDLTRQRVAFF